ncbi:hypothetical protein PInf_009322 [Phytophthora infestans]|nr:hypothetical protein PInf_009322 [Phytophthora infestans]
MVGTHKFDNPEKRLIVEIKPNKGKIGRTFKADVATILEALEALKDDVPRAQAPADVNGAASFQNRVLGNAEGI